MGVMILIRPSEIYLLNPPGAGGGGGRLKLEWAETPQRHVPEEVQGLGFRFLGITV